MSDPNVVVARNTENAPVSDRYSQTVAFSHYNNLSAQLPIDPATGAIVAGGVAEQATQCLKNIEAIVNSIDHDLNDVIRLSIYLRDIMDLNAVEKAMLLGKMEAYCLEQTGMTLKDYSAQLMAESAETVRPLSAFRVTQDGRTDYLVTECRVPVDVLHAATALRSYLLAKGNSAQRFAESLHSVADIAPEVFEDYADELRQGGGRVFAALDIDLDRGEFSALDTVDGWETYAIRDVSTAAWRANRKAGLGWDRRLELFAAHLEPRMIRCGGQGLEAPSGPSM